MSVLQQPPQLGSLAHGKTTVASTKTKLLDAVPAGQSPRVSLFLSNAGSAGVWLRFDGADLPGGLWLAAGAAIALTWPHCPQGEISGIAASGTVDVGWIVGA